MKSLMRICTALLLVAAAGQAQDYRPEDFLPLAVGNSWTYRHTWFDRFGVIGEPEEFHSQELSITITHTEEIDGHVYYVFSEVPYDSPPVPPIFLAGKKVRFSEDGRLMERDQGRETFFYDFAPDFPLSRSFTDSPGYAIKRHDSDMLVLMRSMRYQELPVYGFAVVEKSRVDTLLTEVQIAEFLPCYGIVALKLFIHSLTDQGRIFENSLSPSYAVLNGRRITRAEVCCDPLTSVHMHTWGYLKRFFINSSTRGKDP